MLSPSGESELQELDRLIPQYEEFLFYLPDALVEIDLDTWEIIFMNRMARLMLGYSAEVAPQRIDGNEFLSPADRPLVINGVNLLVGQSRANRTPFTRIPNPPHLEITIVRRDGTTFLADATGSFVLDEDRIPVRYYILFRDITERKREEEERARLLGELQEAVANVKTLHGMLPICAVCKNVRDDRGYWTQIESYIRKHTEADFEHGLCTSCREEVYGPDTGADS